MTNIYVVNINNSLGRAFRSEKDAHAFALELYKEEFTDEFDEHTEDPQSAYQEDIKNFLESWDPDCQYYFIDYDIKLNVMTCELVEEETA